MKKFLFVAFCLVAFAAVNAQTATTAPELISVKETEFNFGKIPQGKPVYHLFEIVNKSDKPLKLDNVAASCGCTTPEWSREEIAPGATSIIKVGYNAAAEGPFEKPITITYAGNQTTVIKIKGEVWKAPAGAAPTNTSLSYLKRQLQ